MKKKLERVLVVRQALGVSGKSIKSTIFLGMFQYFFWRFVALGRLINLYFNCSFFILFFSLLCVTRATALCLGRPFSGCPTAVAIFLCVVRDLFGHVHGEHFTRIISLKLIERTVLAL